MSRDNKRPRQQKSRRKLGKKKTFDYNIFLAYRRFMWYDGHIKARLLYAIGFIPRHSLESCECCLTCGFGELYHDGHWKYELIEKDRKTT